MKSEPWRILIAVLSLMLVAAACGSGDDSESSTADDSQAEEAGTGSEEDSEGATGDAEEIVLQHWYHQYGEDGTFEAAVRYAEEYSAATPGVRVEVTWVPGDYDAALNASLLTDDAPDLFEVQTARLDMVRAGTMEPLDDLFEGVLNDFNETAMSRVTVDGTIYGIPMIVDPQFVYFSKSALADAGVEPPQTMEDLVEASDALSGGRTKGLFLGNDLGATSFLMYMSTWSAGADLISDGQISFDTEGNAAMWDYKQQLAESGSLLVGAPTDWWDPTALNDGLTAMQWSGLWAMPTVVDALGADDVGVMPWPGVDAATPGSIFLGGWNQVVNANSDHVDAAKAYASWLWIENADVQIDWSLSYGFHVPPRASTAAQAEALASGPAADVLSLLDDHGRTTPPIWTGAMDSILSDAHAEVLLNGASPADKLSEAAGAAQAELDSLLDG